MLINPLISKNKLPRFLFDYQLTTNNKDKVTMNETTHGADIFLLTRSNVVAVTISAVRQSIGMALNWLKAVTTIKLAAAIRIPFRKTFIQGTR